MELKAKVKVVVEDMPFSAVLVDCQETEVAGDEHIFVALWKRPDGSEWGTHRVVLNVDTGEHMVTWGHYFRGTDPLTEAYQDYNKRRAADV